MEVATGGTAHDPAAAVVHAWRLLTRKVVETFGSFAEEAARGKPCSQLSARSIKKLTGTSRASSHAGTTAAATNMAEQAIAPSSV